MVSLNSQQGALDAVYRARIMTHLFTTLYKETVWMIKMYINTFIIKKQQHLQGIRFEKDCSNDQDVSMELLGNTRMRLTAKWKCTESLHDCWNMFTRSIWPTKYETRMSTTYRRCVETMKKDKLPTQWHQSMTDRSFALLWENLFNAKTSWPKHKMKAMWAVYQTKCALAVLHFAHACVLWFEPIRKKHNAKQTYLWDLEMSLIFILMLLANWPQIFGHWWKSHEYIDWDWLTGKNGFGPQSAFLGVYLVFGLWHCEKFESFESFITNILPIHYWGVKSRITKIVTPTCFNWQQLTDNLWNPAHNTNHDSQKFTQLTFVTMAIIYYYHYDIIKLHYNCGQFKRNAHFGSSLMSGKMSSAAATIAFVFDSCILSSIQLTKDQEQQVYDTFAKFSKLKLDCANNPKIPGITKYALQYIHRSM